MVRLFISSEASARPLAVRVLLLMIVAACGRSPPDLLDTSSDNPSDASAFRGTGGSGGGDPRGGSGGVGAAADTGADAADAISSGDASAVTCTGIGGPLEGVDIWSDARGPFLLASSSQSGTLLLHRPGTAWNRIYEHAPAPGFTGLSIVGFPGGDLVVGGSVPCGPLILHEGTSRCSAGFWPDDFFVVSNELAYALTGDRVLAYDGSLWTQFLDPFEPRPVQPGWRLWAGDGAVVATAASSEVYVSQDGGPFALVALPPDVLPGSHTYPVTWGFTRNDLWLGTRQGGLYAYDGSTWTKRESLIDACGRGIRGMWGADGVLYLHTDHRLARLRNGKLDVLADFPCDVTLRSIWGNSPAEVYLAAADSRLEPTACGGAEVFVWTGAALLRI